MMKTCYAAIAKRKKARTAEDILISLLTLLLCATLSTVCAPTIARSARAGLIMCAESIAPTLFPFMMLGDIMMAEMRIESSERLRHMFEKAFAINGRAISIFACGVLCGFPTGAKLAGELYGRGEITRDECERLIGFTSNASPAFVIGGIGAGLLGSAAKGLVLYLISVGSSTVCGMLFARGKRASNGEGEVARKCPGFVASVTDATHKTCIACGFVTAFSVIIGLLGALMPQTPLALIAPLLEIGNAAKLLGSAEALNEATRLAGIEFAISFSGLSVHMQVKSMVAGLGISMKSYFLTKLAATLLATGLCAAFGIICGV